MINQLSNEEAIEELKYIKESFAQNALSYAALDMGIKALELTKEMSFNNSPSITFEEYCKRCNETQKEGYDYD